MSASARRWSGLASRRVRWRDRGRSRLDPGDSHQVRAQRTPSQSEFGSGPKFCKAERPASFQIWNKRRLATGSRPYRRPHSKFGIGVASQEYGMSVASKEELAPIAGLGPRAGEPSMLVVRRRG
jgi:hypothetical protein